MDLFNTKKIKDLELKCYTLECLNSELQTKVNANYNHINELIDIVKDISKNLNELDIKIKYLNQLFDELNTAKKYDDNVIKQDTPKKRVSKKTTKTAKKTNKESVDE